MPLPDRRQQLSVLRFLQGQVDGDKLSSPPGAVPGVSGERTDICLEAAAQTLVQEEDVKSAEACLGPDRTCGLLCSHVLRVECEVCVRPGQKMLEGNLLNGLKRDDERFQILPLAIGMIAYAL